MSFHVLFACVCLCVYLDIFLALSNIHFVASKNKAQMSTQQINTFNR